MHRLTWLVVAIALTGCASDAFDSYSRAGTWTHGTDNDANLRAMIVNPHELVEGSAETGSIGAEAASPVTRLFEGKRYPLPAQNASMIGVSPQTQQQGAANPGPSQ
jgi:hypothetical protein